MADTLPFELVSPERTVCSYEVGMVVVPGSDGNIGVLPGHALLITTLRPGVIDIYQNGKVDTQFFIGGGFCEISPENGCTVLTEEAVALDDIDHTAATERLKTAQKALDDADNADGANAKARAEAEVKRAEAMIEAGRS